MLTGMEVHPSLVRSFSPPSTASHSHSRAPDGSSASSFNHHHKSQAGSSSFSAFDGPRASSSQHSASTPHTSTSTHHTSTSTHHSASTHHTSASTLWSPSSLANSPSSYTGPLANSPSSYTGPNSTSSHTANSISSHTANPIPSHTANSISSHTPPVTATENVINRVADKGSSLFQACTKLQKRLDKVPDFSGVIDDVQLNEHTGRDPVASLWGAFRLGWPFLLIFNVFQPDDPLPFLMNDNADKNRKLAVMKFIALCKERLGFQNDECFIVQDVLGNDINGFVKAVRLVSRVLDIQEQQGLIEPPTLDQLPPSLQDSVKRTQRQHIVDELVRTERTYVQHLEGIDELKMYIEQRGAIPGDPVNDIFLNIHAILDFQRRFLIRVEQVNALPEDMQDWGELFLHSGPGMQVYGNYILNQRQCEAVSFRYHEKLREATIGAPVELQQMVETANTLGAFLLKPFLRLTKYPLLLKELARKGDLDEVKRSRVEEAGQNISRILEDANNLVRKDELLAAYSELEKAIDDWKTHDPVKFGDLLDYGHFIVLKGSEREDRANEREYVLYMFENILLCCKDVTNKKSKLVPSANRQTPGRASRPGQPKKLNLKGRIYPFNIEDIISFGKLDNYLLKVTWYGETNQLESLNIRFPTEELMVKWRDRLEAQRKACKASQEAKQLAYDREQQRNSDESQHRGYQEAFDGFYNEDNVFEDGSAYPIRHSSREELGLVSHQMSSSSLQSRSTTGDSTVQPLNMPFRAPPSRQNSGTPLTLRTQHLQNNLISPNERTANSYFSPTADSPMSSRTSSSSGVLPFSKQLTPQNSWPEDPSGRFTAPVGARPHVNREMSNGSFAGARNPAHKSMPMHPAALAQTRNRSKSSSHAQTENGYNSISGSVQPPVPSLPSHYSTGMPSVSRSQNSTPIYANGGIPRSMAQSPTSGPQSLLQRGYYKQADAESEYGSRSDSHWSSSTLAAPSNSVPSTLDGPGPNMFKVKILVPSETSSFMIVVPNNISYSTLRDRIDAKLARTANITLAKGGLRLQFKDDDEFISIQTDEDVSTAFEIANDQDAGTGGQFGELDLFCQK